MSEAGQTRGSSTPAPGGSHEVDGRRDTARLEAFSDGVFAIAITLLVLTFKVPPVSKPPSPSLFETLSNQGPAYLAYLNSFFAILVMWIAHHNMFRYIIRTDHVLLLVNGLLLLGVAVVPFPTALLAEYLQAGTYPDQQTAVAVSCGTFAYIALTYNLLYWRAFKGRRLTDPNTSVELSPMRLLSYTLRPWLYLGALALALSPLPYALQASLVIYTLMALLYALPPPRLRLSVPTTVKRT